MYIPKFFQVNDFKEIEQFIQSNSFGMIVTEDQGKPLATHLPLFRKMVMIIILVDILPKEIRNGRL